MLKQTKLINEQHEDKIKNDVIEGLTIIENVINKEMHDQLWKDINKLEWSTELSRRTQHFGYKYNYKSRSLKDEDIAEPLPQWAINLCNHLIELKHITEIPQQLIINEYKDNQGISAHVDSKIFDNIIFSVSLGDQCRMIFKQSKHPSPTSPPGTKVETTKIEKQLNPRSLMLIKDSARYNWTHEIPKLKKGQHRISLTFRYVTLKPTKSKTNEISKTPYSKVKKVDNDDDDDVDE